MPSFAGASEWLDSEPLGPIELHGHGCSWTSGRWRLRGTWP